MTFCLKRCKFGIHSTLNTQLKYQNKISDIFNLDKLIESLSTYVELKLQIYELRVKEQLVVAITKIAVLSIILLFGIIMIFFFSMALAYFLNSWLGSEFLGFALVGAAYLAIGLVILFLQGRLIKNHLFQAFFSDTILNSENDDEHEERIED